MEFGTFNNVRGETPTALRQVNLGVRARVFSSSMPPYSQHIASRFSAAGVPVFFSDKPPANDVAGLAAGKYDAQLIAAVKGAPRGSLFTIYHEPEDNLSQPEFGHMIRHVARVVHANAPGVQVGYVAMEYQWQIGHGYTTLDTHHLDFLAIDVYGRYWNVGKDASTNLADMKGFAAWYKWASKTGLPLRVAEIGISRTETARGGTTHSFTDAQRARWLGSALVWLRQHDFRSVSYWNADAGTPVGGAAAVTYAISGTHPDPLTLGAWRSVRACND